MQVINSFTTESLGSSVIAFSAGLVRGQFPHEAPGLPALQAIPRDLQA